MIKYKGHMSGFFVPMYIGNLTFTLHGIILFEDTQLIWKDVDCI
jgi:hypothetical protein